MEESTDSPIKFVRQTTEPKRWAGDGWSENEDDEMELRELERGW